LIANSPVAPGLRRIGILESYHLGGAVAFWHMDTTGAFSSRKLECATYGDVSGDLHEMQIYCIRVAGGPDRSGTLALFRAAGAEDAGRARALIVGRS
jgi:hypothetical protein